MNMVENPRVAEGGLKMPGLILLDGFNPGLSGGKRVETRARRGVDRTGGENEWCYFSSRCTDRPL